MKYTLVISFFLAACLSFDIEGTAYADEPAYTANDFIETFSHHFENTIRQHWRPTTSINGIRSTVFDYSGLAKELKHKNSNFSKAVSALGKVDTSKFKKDDKEKAFWINAYNIGAIKLVADNYPVDSIRSFKVSLVKDPWSQKALNIGGNLYTLREIEKDILLKRFADPRIVFAVSCAAVSCPDRPAEIFHSARLDRQLDQLIREFMSNPTKGACLYREQSHLILSWIFKADSHLFNGEKRPSVIEFVSRYLPADDAKWLAENQDRIRLSYFKHDWTLNDTRQVEQSK